MSVSTRTHKNERRRQQLSEPRREREVALRPLEDIVTYAREFAREQPEMAALWCLGIGFALGWKLKPW
jgi:hypothetical protein